MVICSLILRTQAHTAFNERPQSMCIVARFLYPIFRSLRFSFRSSSYFHKNTMTPILRYGAEVFLALNAVSGTLTTEGGIRLSGKWCYTSWGLVSSLSVRHRTALSSWFVTGYWKWLRVTVEVFVILSLRQRTLVRSARWLAHVACPILPKGFPSRSVIDSGCVRNCDLVTGGTRIVRKQLET